jgi:type I restriction enzyme, R subunit
VPWYFDWRQRAQARAQVRLAIEDTLDDGLPRAYTPDLYEEKVAAVFEHVFESYRRREQRFHARGLTTPPV